MEDIGSGVGHLIADCVCSPCSSAGDWGTGQDHLGALPGGGGGWYVYVHVCYGVLPCNSQEPLTEYCNVTAPGV